MLLEAKARLKMNYTKVNQDGKRSVYYADAAKKYKEKITQYGVTFSLKDAELLDFLRSEMQSKNMTAGAYLKMLLAEKMETNKS